ncbi:MAG: hypothetical protein GYA39_01410 [Methanothrix sp.]|nr:hypothetical protein [Methanothrix sp.]
MSECVNCTIRAWEEEFGSVLDRLPLRLGIVAFPRMMPFQAVIEAARNLEKGLQERSEKVLRPLWPGYPQQALSSAEGRYK